MPDDTGSSSEPKQIALQRCDDLIAWYERHKVWQRTLDSALQITVIVASGLTAFAAALGSWPRWAIVLPAIATTVATGLNLSFRFRSQYVNFATAGERLKWAKLRYLIRADKPSGATKSLEEFVNEMEAIVTGELTQWSRTVLTGDLAGGTAALQSNDGEGTQKS